MWRVGDAMGEEVDAGGEVEGKLEKRRRGLRRMVMRESGEGRKRWREKVRMMWDLRPLDGGH